MNGKIKRSALLTIILAGPGLFTGEISVVGAGTSACIGAGAGGGTNTG